MKKTLMITVDFPPIVGGVANYWNNLSRYLSPNDYFVIAPECDNSIAFDKQQNYVIYRQKLISKKKWLWPKWLPILLNAVKIVLRENIEIMIAAQILPVGTVCYVINKFLKIPYAVSAHGLDIAFTQGRPRKKWLAKKILSNAKFIIVNSQFTKELIRRHYGNDLAEIIIIYPCPHLSFKQISQEKIENEKGKYCLCGKRILLTVGRLIERKGHSKVIEALAKLVGVFPDLAYLIIGDGPELARLKKQAQALNLSGHVMFLTDITDQELPVFYSMADAFIMLSRELDNGDVEGFGIVYLEANLFGKPVIVGNSGGAREAVENKETGLLVSSESIEEIIEAIKFILQNKDKADEMGRIGRQRVLEKFTWELQSKKLKVLLE